MSPVAVASDRSDELELDFCTHCHSWAVVATFSNCVQGYTSRPSADSMHTAIFKLGLETAKVLQKRYPEHVACVEAHNEKETTQEIPAIEEKVERAFLGSKQ